MRYVRPRLEMCCAGTGMVGVSHELPVGGVLLPTQWDCGTSPARGSLAIVVADNEGAELGVSPVLPGGFGAPGMPSSSGTGAGVSDKHWLPGSVLPGSFGLPGTPLVSGWHPFAQTFGRCVRRVGYPENEPSATKKETTEKKEDEDEDEANV